MAAEYPVITWPVTPSGTIDVRANAVTSTLTPAATAVYGFGTDGSGNRTSDTLAKAFEVALETHLQIGIVTASYVWDGASGWPRTQYSINKTGDDASDRIFWDTAATLVPADYGYDVSLGDADISGGTSVVSANTLNSAGYWAPRSLAKRITPNPEQLSYGSFAPAAPATNQRRSWGQRTFRRIEIEWINRAYLLREWAADSAFAGRVGRNVLDTHNTLQGFLDAVATGAEFRIYVAHGEHATGVVASSEPVGFEAIAQQMSDPNRYAVSTVFVDTSDYVTP